MPDDGMRHELVDGNMVTSPVPPPPHQYAGQRLIRILYPAAPLELDLTTETNIRIGPDLFIPDVMLAKSEALCAPGSLYVVPEDVLMIVEVISPSISKLERAWKPQRYADGGIPFYMEIDLPTMPRVTVYELRDTKYEKIADVRAGEALKLTAPIELSFDPGELVGPRR